MNSNETTETVAWTCACGKSFKTLLGLDNHVRRNPTH